MKSPDHSYTRKSVVRPNTIETFILTLSESQKLYNIKTKQKYNRKSKLLKDTTNQLSNYRGKPRNTKRIKPPLFYDSPGTGIR